MVTLTPQQIAVQAAVREMNDAAYKLYQAHGQYAVSDLGVKLGLPFHECKECETETPTLDKTCLVCGQSKDVTNDLDINDKDCRIAPTKSTTWVRVGNLLVYLTTSAIRFPGQLLLEVFDENADPELEGPALVTNVLEVE